VSCVFADRAPPYLEFLDRVLRDELDAKQKRYSGT